MKLENTEIEQAFLAALMIDQSHIADIDIMTDAFAAEYHGQLYGLIKNKYFEKGAVSLVDFKDLECPLEDYDSYEYMRAVIDSAYTSVNAPEYAQEIKELHERRQIRKVLDEAREFVTKKPPHEVKSYLNSFLQDTMISKSVVSAQEIHEVILASFEMPSQAYKTGIEGLDKATQGGFFAGFTYGFAGKEKAGKTLLAQTISYNMAENGVKHLYIALEMGSKQIQERNYARKLGKNSLQFLEPDDLLKGEVARIKPSDCVWYLDAPGITTQEILNEVSMCQMRHGITGFILDYWQLVGGADRRETEERHLRYVAQGVADFARKRGLWCMILAQQNNDGKLFGGNGLRKACDQLYFIELPEAEEHPPRRYLRMDATRYTPLIDVGNDAAGGLYINQTKGPYFFER